MKETGTFPELFIEKRKNRTMSNFAYFFNLILRIYIYCLNDKNALLIYVTFCLLGARENFVQNSNIGLVLTQTIAIIADTLADSKKIF